MDPECLSEDRRYADQWDLPNGLWTCAAVFDGEYLAPFSIIGVLYPNSGHVGSDLAELAVVKVPERIKRALETAFKQSTDGEVHQPTVEQISNILSHELAAFDNSILGDFLRVFPKGEESLASLSIPEVKHLINDHSTGSENYAKMMRCMCGTTALIGLVDPNRSNLWIANLGDCQASASLCFQIMTAQACLTRPALGTENGEGDLIGLLLTQNHNAANHRESERIHSEHPGEPDCIRNERLLGAITVTRGSFNLIPSRRDCIETPLQL